MVSAVIVGLTCLFAVASAQFLSTNEGLGTNPWVNGYGFNGFQGVGNGLVNG